MHRHLKVIYLPAHPSIGMPSLVCPARLWHPSPSSFRSNPFQIQPLLRPRRLGVPATPAASTSRTRSLRSAYVSTRPDSAATSIAKTARRASPSPPENPPFQMRQSPDFSGLRFGCLPSIHPSKNSLIFRGAGAEAPILFFARSSPSAA